MKYFSSLVIFFFSMSFMNEGKFHKPAFDVQGHRGCRGLMPENTIPAMLKASIWCDYIGDGCSDYKR